MNERHVLLGVLAAAVCFGIVAALPDSEKVAIGNSILSTMRVFEAAADRHPFLAPSSLPAQAGGQAAAGKLAFTYQDWDGTQYYPTEADALNDPQYYEPVEQTYWEPTSYYPTEQDAWNDPAYVDPYEESYWEPSPYYPTEADAWNGPQYVDSAEQTYWEPSPYYPTEQDAWNDPAYVDPYEESYWEPSPYYPTEADAWNDPYYSEPYNSDYYGYSNQGNVIYVKEEPWYVRSFPGVGQTISNILPPLYQPKIIAQPAPRPIQPPQPRIQPTCTISASPQNIQYGGSTLVSWSSHYATRAELNGIGTVALSGTRTISGITSSRTVGLTVTGAGGTNACYTTVVVSPQQPKPSCVISVHPDSIRKGEVASLAWGSQNAARASLSGYGDVDTGGGTLVSPQKTTSFTLTVYSSSGQKAVCQTTLRVQ